MQRSPASGPEDESGRSILIVDGRESAIQELRAILRHVEIRVLRTSNETPIPSAPPGKGHATLAFEVRTQVRSATSADAEVDLTESPAQAVGRPTSSSPVDIEGDGEVGVAAARPTGANRSPAGMSPGTSTAPAIRVGALTIDPSARAAFVGDQDLDLTAKEFDLLSMLVLAPGRVLSRSSILKAVWQSHETWQTAATVTEHIYRLRGKLDRVGMNPNCIRTLRSRGYLFDPNLVGEPTGDPALVAPDDTGNGECTSHDGTTDAEWPNRERMLDALTTILDQSDPALRPWFMNAMARISMDSESSRPTPDTRSPSDAESLLEIPRPPLPVRELFAAALSSTSSNTPG